MLGLIGLRQFEKEVNLDTLGWLKSLLLDKRWWLNVLIGIALWIASYRLLIIVVSDTGYNSVAVNVVIDVLMTIVWYPINRWLLFVDRNSSFAPSAGRSLAWWAVTFPLNQAIYALTVLVIHMPYTWAKPALVIIGLAEFFANYWFKDRKAFAHQPLPKTVLA